MGAGAKSFVMPFNAPPGVVGLLKPGHTRTNHSNNQRQQQPQQHKQPI
jgi:hypothetical protein